MGPLGWQETIFIFFLALILFGPKKLPELGRTLGKAMTEFRRASNELKATFDREMKTLEAETESLKDVTNTYQTDTYNYDYSTYDSGNYEGAYGGESHDSTATHEITASASAPQDAESPSAVPPEGTVAHGTETAAVTGHAGNHSGQVDEAGHTTASTAESKA
jgi:TatA/E family protein of Tat protein translocase